MKLGILAVYMFDQCDEPLFDVHLTQIEKYTQVPFEIFCSTNRLAPSLRGKLTRIPRIRICDVPDTDLRGSREHSHYLDHLVQVAADSDVSHIVTLHLDSFPVRAGWAEELAGRLSGTCAFATLDRINTACLFFTRDFYERYRPTFRPTVAEWSDRKFREYLELHDPAKHSGIGFGFTAYTNGLSWSYLQPTAGSHDEVGRIYDDMVLHIRNATRREPQRTKRRVTSSALYRGSMELLTSIGRAVLPRAATERLRARFPASVFNMIDRPRVPVQDTEFERIRSEIVSDPEAYVDQLRKRHLLGDNMWPPAT